MTLLADQLDKARAKVIELERRIGAATCAEIGRHDWESVGGCNCGCPVGACSVPVHRCKRCGDCDYGENDEAREIRRACADRRHDDDGHGELTQEEKR